MRKKIGKRVGPAPIAVVAALALAAFISAGLWLVPGSGQTAEAQSVPVASGTIDDKIIDQGQGITVDAASVFNIPTVNGTPIAVEYTISSDDDGDQTPNSLLEADGTTGDTTDAGQDITVSSAGVVTIPAALTTGTVVAGDNSASITVRLFYDGSDTGTDINTNDELGADDPYVGVQFRITVVQDPMMYLGKDPVNPGRTANGTNDAPKTRTNAAWWTATESDSDCMVTANDGTNDTVRSRGEAVEQWSHSETDDRQVTYEARLISGGKCTTDKDSVVVKFLNENPTDDQAGAGNVPSGLCQRWRQVQGLCASPG